MLAPGPHAGTPLQAVNLCVAAIRFAFLGVECASIPAGHVRDPEKTIPRTTLLGTAITAVLYILGVTAVMGLVPATTLAIAGFGCLNGWTLIAGQFPQAVARDGLLPQILARESARGTPTVALLVSSMVTSAMLLMNYNHGLVAMFTFMVLLTTLGSVVAYLFSTMADIVLAYRSGSPLPWRHLIMACGAFAFSVWATVGAGQEAVYWNFVLLILGLPLYVWQVRHAQQAVTQRRDESDDAMGLSK